VEKQEELTTDCEAVWVKLTLRNGKPLYIRSYYRAHVSDQESLAAFRSALARIPRHARVIVAGDLNFPDLSWPSRTLHAGTSYARNHLDFLDLLDDFALTQMVEGGTRQDRTLDVVLTNTPTQCTSTQVVAGISDHEAVVSNFNLNHRINPQERRQAPLYSKADWVKLAAHVTSFHNSLLDKDLSNTSVDELWESFRDTLHTGIRNHIPHKTVKPGKQKPWVNRRLQRMLRKKNQLFYKQKYGTQEDKDRYKATKKIVQREMRRGYWRHVEDVVTPTADASPHERTKCSKRFWGLVKHSGNDSIGIPGLADDRGLIHEDAATKAELLNKQFTSVFSPHSAQQPRP